MDSAQKQLLRAVLRQVHPDLFVGFPVEREQNSEALKVRIFSKGMPVAGLLLGLFPKQASLGSALPAAG